MATWIEAPPAQRGMGCFAKGCLLFLAFGFLLSVAFIAGTYYAWQKVLPSSGIDLPRTTFTQEQLQKAEQRWDEFSRAAEARQPARIELTPEEINALILAENPDWKGRVYVSVDNDVGRVRVSIPMGDSGWLKGHFINAEGTVQPDMNGSASDAKITSVVVNGQSVNDILQWEFFGWSLPNQVTDWCEDYNLKTFNIQNGKVILETRGE